MPQAPSTIGFDADDTLWHNETLFRAAHEQFSALLSRHHDAATVERRLYETEMRNLSAYGYGIKAFTLSVIETAAELAGESLGADEVREILRMGQSMLAAPVELLPGAREAVRALAERYRLVVITKGDLLDQERKIADSGLAPYFSAQAVVSHKDASVYRRLLQGWRVEPSSFLMVGNSLRSDILPVLELGGQGVWIPYPLVWAHEQTADRPHGRDGFTELPSLGELPGWLEHLPLPRR